MSVPKHAQICSSICLHEYKCAIFFLHTHLHVRATHVFMHVSMLVWLYSAHACTHEWAFSCACATACTCWDVYLEGGEAGEEMAATLPSLEAPGWTGTAAACEPGCAQYHGNEASTLAGCCFESIGPSTVHLGQQWFCSLPRERTSKSDAFLRFFLLFLEFLKTFLLTSPL